METDTYIPIRLNGEETAITPGTSIADVLLTIGLDPTIPKGIAVAVNDEVVRRGDWPSKRLEKGDRVEVITARQGG
jgi:sulfur carrier protein